MHDDWLWRLLGRTSQIHLPRNIALDLLIKAHRGEPLNEKADTQAENARQLSSECQQWTTRTQRMTYEWNDSDGVQHVTAWSKAIRDAMLRGGAEYHRQRVLDRAGPLEYAQ